MPKNGQKRAFFAKNPDEVSGENRRSKKPKKNGIF